jgi:hypothetical protein
MANQFLIKNTMADMRNLSAIEIASLQGINPTYAGVELLGYYEKGDTPAPIIYNISENDNRLDDGGGIITVGINRLVHNFESVIDVRYFGLCSSATYINDPAFVNNIFINNAGKSILFDHNTDFIMDMGTSWNDGTIKVVNNTTVIIHGNIRHRSSINANASMFLVQDVDNITFEGTGTLIGYKHKRPAVDNIYYKHFDRFNGTYQVGDYVTLNSFGYKVVQLGRVDRDPYPTTNSVIGEQFVLKKPNDPTDDSQFMKLELFEKGLGEWEYGIYVYSATNVNISGITLREFWGDGSAVAGYEVGKANKPSESIKYDHVSFIDNRRQGLSLVNCSNVEIDHCLFSKTYGTLPMAGIDLEPNPTKDGTIRVSKVTDVRITNSTFTDNYQGIAMFNPYTADPSRIDNIYLANNEMRDNLISNLGVVRSGKVTVERLRSYPTKVGNYSGDISICAANFTLADSYIESDANYSANQTNLHVINLVNTFTELSMMKRFLLHNTELRGLNDANQSFLNIPFACPDLDIKCDHLKVYDVGTCLVATGSTVTQLKSMVFENCYFRGYAGYLGSKTIAMEKLDYINNTFDLKSRTNVVNESLITVPVGCQLANIVGNTFTGLELVAEQSDNSLITVRNTGAGVRTNILRNIFKNIGKVSYPIIETFGGNSTPSYVVDSNSFISCYVNNYIRVNRSSHGLHFILNNIFTRASVEDTIKALGTTVATGFRLLINMNVFQSAAGKNIVASELYATGYAIAQSNTINHTFRYKDEEVLNSATNEVRGLVNRCAVASDTAMLPGVAYTQSEVHGILIELRDLKNKMRAAGILES